MLTKQTKQCIIQIEALVYLFTTNYAYPEQGLLQIIIELRCICLLVKETKKRRPISTSHNIYSY